VALDGETIAPKRMTGSNRDRAGDAELGPRGAMPWNGVEREARSPRHDPPFFGIRRALNSVLHPDEESDRIGIGDAAKLQWDAAAGNLVRGRTVRPTLGAPTLSSGLKFLRVRIRQCGAFTKYRVGSATGRRSRRNGTLR
jgi:hypothetical protein